MTTTIHQRRTTHPDPRGGGGAAANRILSHPAAFVATTVILFALFGWTFVSSPDRVAPTKDPAYYTWRTEVLISERPVTLLEIEGAFGMFAGGYRITAPVIGGFLRHIPGTSVLNVTVVLMVALPVLTALSLATFAFRQRPDPLIWHSVAFGSASLFLTPPFVGYLDNVLCLFWLAASLPFLPGTRTSARDRVCFGGFLVLAGLTHPTTLAIFCLSLGAMAVVRLLVRHFDVKSVVHDDGWMLATAFGAALISLAVWSVGIWGKSASLSEAALPPPYGSDFFLDRMVLWVKAMRPALNGPLFAIGAVGLLAAGRRAAEDDLARVAIVWLASLAGLFGFAAGLTYPYYRFFNTTLAWVLLVGLGIYFAARWFIDVSTARGLPYLALLGIVALAVVVGTNFATGFRVSGWNRPEGGWLSDSQRRELDALRGTLEGTDQNRPVVFVIDDEPAEPFQIWGFTKLSGNTSRYGLPAGQIDRGYLYLGSLDNYLSDRPTERGDETYDKLSPALLEDTREGIQRSNRDPIVVVASAFNQTGANTDIASGQKPPAETDAEVWVLNSEGVNISGISQRPLEESDEPGFLHLLRVLGGLALLLLPGYLVLRYFVSEPGLPEVIGMVPPLALGILTLAGVVTLAVFRSPFSGALAAVSLGIALLASGVVFVRSGRRSAPAPT
jgi:hypothetical protein